MNRKRIYILFILLLGAAAILFAQQPTAIVEYFENNSGDLIVSLDGEEYSADEFDFGEELLIGSILITGEGDYAEIRLEPNGSIIRVSENTNFQINGLQGRDESKINNFQVAVGKFRAVLAKEKGARYQFRGSSAVCGVRGTDFGMSVLPGETELVFVIDGLIDFTNAAGATIEVGAGFSADALAPVFQASAETSEAMADFLAGLDFKVLKKTDVPGYEKVEIPEKAEKPEDEEVEEAKEGLMAKLMQILGFEIGSVTMGGETYAKAIIQPRFAFGKFKIALYLPIIYQENMLDPADWHKPDGNNEWSFGTDQDEWDRIASDFIEDLFLKIRYIEYGKQRDPFFFKLGNLNNITVGHGMIMRNYANDSDFPAVRKVGVNLGIDAENSGVEAMVNNAADPEIFGARLYFRPMGSDFPLAFGITVLTDIDPDEEEAFGDPILLNGCFDLDYPLLHTDSLSMILFADIATMLPYFRKDVPGPYTISSGLAGDAIWDGERLKNWGFATGILGNILPVDYRLEFRYSDGTFIPGFYNNIYERRRSEYVEDIVNYLEDPNNPEYKAQTMGIYGEAGYTMEKVFFFEAGYLWPWYINNTGEGRPEDFLHVKVGIMKGLLPVYASVSYDRFGLITNLLDGESVDFIDVNTVLSAEVVYPVAPVLELAVVVVNNFVEGDSYISVSILTRANY